ncbi:zinc finger and SCAN domain-containing protein 2 [Oryzias melastigma]|uniref:zinc finger and SCAN domain-containing protein 2 n=1 Tax=Oryzias melastigma TaxID=30732 RepID=UPI000CF7BF62|nr:zinc finger and SCAN domain-containing protein 2 [Oryzias melastigma]
MSSLQSLREFISERLAAAAEEIFRHCEGTIVQYEQELCRQRKLLDIRKPQLQPNAIVQPQHYVSEKEDFCNKLRNSRMEREEPEPAQIKEEPEEAELPQMKEEQERLCIIQVDEQLDLKQETDTLMEIPTYGENEHNEGDLHNPQSFDITDSQSEEGNQVEESTSSTDEETDPENQDQRKRGERSHDQNVDKQSCIMSGEQTRTSHNATVQIRTESDDRSYVCEECGKGFGYWFTFKNHMRSHTGEKPYACKRCETSFSQISHLKMHMRTHTGEKPFSCGECDKLFRSKSCLKRHMRIHTGEKPFSCKVCDKSFSCKSNLKTHMRTHTGEKPFSCQECDASFSYLTSLRRHQNSHK